MDIKSFNLKEEINNFLKYKDFKKFLPVQSKVIPLLLKQNNLFIEAPTGTGKTLSFLIPILNNLDLLTKKTQAIIIAPSKELSIQIHGVLKEMKEFFKTEITSCLAIGGEDFNSQIRKINNGSQIIIGTLDRINSLRNETKHDISNLKFLIMDEVDMLLNFGIFENLDLLKKDIPNEALLGFFSASFPIETQNYLKKEFKKEIKNIIIKSDSSANITSNFIKAFDNNKIETLINLLKSDVFNPYFCLIFAKTNEEVKEIYNVLKEEGIKNLGFFNKDLDQRERKRLLKLINDSKLVFLVTTDLMARGMDFPGVTHIINYSLPVDLTYYKHRIGRTNRNVVKGNIYDIYVESDLKKYNDILKKNKNIEFKKMKVK